MWISQVRRIDDVGYLDKLTRTVESVRFEIWYKEQCPIVHTFCSQDSGQWNRSRLDHASRLLQSLGSQVPQTFRESEKPLQKYVDGSIPFRGCQHEVILFRRSQQTPSLGQRCVSIGLGVVDFNLWLAFDEPLIFSEPREILQNYSYLEYGLQWERKIPFRVLPT